MILIDTTSLSLNGGVKSVEVYVPLWWASGSTGSNTQTTSAGSGSSMIADGGTVTYGPTGYTPTQLFTLSSKSPFSTNFAFEATFNCGTSNTGNVALWDITSNTIVSGSQVSLSNVTAKTIVRSGTFTLIPSHVYGVTIWQTSQTATTYVCDASLIIFP
jgi:hypothetical protein